MESEYQEVTKSLYKILSGLPRFSHEVQSSSLPPNGVYFFFEKGETLEIDGQQYDRIVRVGTHVKDGNFPGRIRQHYGNRNSLSGNKNGSVFRKHLGGALMRKRDPNDPRLNSWLLHMGESDSEVEEWVSRCLRNNFSFSCIRVDDAEERLALESGLIALLAQHPLARMSNNWLGLFAESPVIRSTGIWNTQKVDSVPLTIAQLHRISQLAGAIPEKIQREKKSTLVIIPCGKKKIWNINLNIGSSAAKDAYISDYFKLNRQYAELMGDRWVILSAKYGYINPETLIENYNVSFKDKNPEVVSIEKLTRQIHDMGLYKYTELLALGGIEYREMISRSFAGIPINIVFPFAGNGGIITIMSATRNAIGKNGDQNIRNQSPRGMNQTNSDKILSYLNQAQKRYCDGCLMDLLQIKPHQQVNQICNRLASNSAIKRKIGICDKCRMQKLVNFRVMV